MKFYSHGSAVSKNGKTYRIKHIKEDALDFCLKHKVIQPFEGGYVLFYHEVEKQAPYWFTTDESLVTTVSYPDGSDVDMIDACYNIFKNFMNTTTEIKNGSKKRSIG